MYIFKKYLFLFFGILSFSLFGQERDTLKLGLASAEEILLENNLELLAEELNLDIANAEKIQAKVWPNPTLNIEEVNPYASSYQKQHAEEQASLLGSERFGKYRQIAIQIEQLVYVSGRRKKQKALADVSKDKAAVYLEQFLLNLKTEFRKDVYELSYHQANLGMLEKEMESVSSIVNAYENQSDRGNVNKSRLMRLRASKMKIKDEITQEKNKLSILQSRLIVLLNLSNNTWLSFKSVFQNSYNYQNALNYTLVDLQEKAMERRPDIRLSEIENEWTERKLDYEKSLGVPDFTFSLGYDRGGGIYPDFWGLGVSFDLPFTNPNKGEIRKAELEVKQQNYHHDQSLVKAKAEVKEKYERIQNISRFFEDTPANYSDDLDNIMKVYTKNFRFKSISLIEFIDFLETYVASKRSIFQNQRDYLNAVEELKYATGLNDIIK